MIYRVGDTYYAGALFLDSTGAGITGESPVVHIRRASDGMFWTGSGYSATPTDLAMTEVSAANAPGEYLYAFTPTTAGQYFGTCFEAAGGAPYGGTIVGPVQPFEVYFGIGWTENLDAAVSSVLTAVSATVSSFVEAVRSLFDFLSRRKQEEAMARIAIPYQTDILVSFIAPTDEEGENPLDNTNDGATCSFKVYDPTKDEQLRETEPGAETVWAVTNAGVFQTGDTVECALDAGGVHADTIISVDPTANTITVTTGLASQASADARVRVRLGGEISMSEYGTAKLGRRDWGFRGTLPDDHPGLELGADIDLEMTLVGGVGLNRLVALLLNVSVSADTMREESSGALMPAVTN